MMVSCKIAILLLASLQTESTHKSNLLRSIVSTYGRQRVLVEDAGGEEYRDMQRGDSICAESKMPVVSLRIVQVSEGIWLNRVFIFFLGLTIRAYDN